MAPIANGVNAAMAIERIAKRHLRLPLQSIKHWSDEAEFQLDALGLVTLLGAEEVSVAVGSLQYRRFTEALPLLATFVLAGDRFTSVQSGFAMYNLSDGITTSELRGWFTRWLISETVNNATTIFEWKPRAGPRPGTSFASLAVSSALVTPLLAGTVLMGDWYGVGNAVAIILTIITRMYLLHQQRLAREHLACTPTVSGHDEIKTVCVTRSDGKMVTLKVPESCLRTFYMAQEVENPMRYRLARYVAWLALGAHLLILGMSTLVTQIYTVVLLVSSTVAMCSNLNLDLDRQQLATRFHSNGDPQDSIVRIAFSDKWDVIKTNPSFTQLGAAATQSTRDRRQVAWAQLQPSEWQEAQMQRWNLLPGLENKRWWHEYRCYKQSLHTLTDEKIGHRIPPAGIDEAQQNASSANSTVTTASHTPEVSRPDCEPNHV